MKQTLFLILMVASVNVFATDKYNVNVKESKLNWEGFKPGSSHDGVVYLSSGIVEVKNDKVVGGEFTINFNSIENFDVKDEGWRAKLVDHLKSEDFFYTEKYPYGRFVINSVENESGDNYTVTGDLTARGKTNEVTFSANIVVKSGVVSVESSDIELDRTKWDLKYNSKKFNADLLKDKVIEDKMKVKVLLTAKAK